MATINAATLQDQLDDADLADEDAEVIIDDAVDTLNAVLHSSGQELANMTGTAGSKTLSVESYQKGAIMQVAKRIYAMRKNPSATNSQGVGGVSISYHGSADFMDFVRLVAGGMKEIEVSRG
jgi:hypothetical protein